LRIEHESGDVPFVLVGKPALEILGGQVGR
jgi:hypothetical protein